MSKLRTHTVEFGGRFGSNCGEIYLKEDVDKAVQVATTKMENSLQTAKKTWEPEAYKMGYEAAMKRAKHIVREVLG